MSIMLQFELFYILEIFHTCLIFENNASQVPPPPSFYKQQRIAEVANLHHIWQPQASPGTSFLTPLPSWPLRGGGGERGDRKADQGPFVQPIPASPRPQCRDPLPLLFAHARGRTFCDQIVMCVLEGDKVGASL